MRRLFVLLLTLSLCFFMVFFPRVIQAKDISVNAKAAVLIEARTGKILFAYNKDQKLPPASVTKVMTLLLIMEAVDRGDLRLSDKIKTSTEAAGMGGSQVFLKEGEVMTAAEMIKAITMVSANDASAAVAEYLVGSIDGFIALMNARAKELGMDNTNFVNETGLPAGDHYSTAYDISIMSRELLKHQQILRWSSTWLDSLRGGEFILRNTNELIKAEMGVDGLKTGFTRDAGFCLVATASKGGMRLISVLLGAESNDIRLKESAKLLDYGFEKFSLTRIGKKDEVVGSVKVKKAKIEEVKAFPAADYWLVVERGKESLLEKDLIQKELEAPLPAGAKVGHLQISLGDKVVDKAEVITRKKVEKANFFVLIWREIIARLRKFFSFWMEVGS